MINVTRTYLPPLEDYTAYLKQVWDSVWLTNRGKLVLELEQKLKETLGVKNLLVVNNGTIAIQIAIKALDLKGEIITTPFSYVATTSSIVWENCTPVFVDIEPDYLTIDATLIEKAITPRTTAILATHVYGNPCNIEAIEAIAQKHNLKVIYDAAHCFGATYKGKSVFSYGDISTTSFHATKLFHTGEGGAIFANNDDVFHKCTYMHNFGHNGPENFYGIGVNGKISELNGAMGLCVLPKVPELIAGRKGVSTLYSTKLASLDIQLLKVRTGTEFNYSYYPVVFKSEEQLLGVKKALNDNDIFPRRYFYPSLNELPYVSKQSCPVSESISRRVLCLPLYYGLTLNDAERVSQIIINNITL